MFGFSQKAQNWAAKRHGRRCAEELLHRSYKIGQKQPETDLVACHLFALSQRNLWSLYSDETTSQFKLFYDGEPCLLYRLGEELSLTQLINDVLSVEIPTVMGSSFNPQALESAFDGANLVVASVKPVNRNSNRNSFSVIFGPDKYLSIADKILKSSWMFTSKGRASDQKLCDHNEIGNMSDSARRQATKDRFEYGFYYGWWHITEILRGVSSKPIKLEKLQMDVEASIRHINGKRPDIGKNILRIASDVQIINTSNAYDRENYASQHIGLDLTALTVIARRINAKSYMNSKRDRGVLCSFSLTANLNESSRMHNDILMAFWRAHQEAVYDMHTYLRYHIKTAQLSQ